MHDFHDLSPLDFEDLVRDLLQAEFGVRIESFGPGRDGGIDCRFAASAKNTIVQAKHYFKTGRGGLLRTLVKEDLKVAKLKPDRYILAASVSLTPAFKDKIIGSMPSAPLAVADIIGLEDLNNLLNKHPDVEKKHFKLWLGSVAILERILQSGIYNRTETELEIIKEMIPRFVQNQSVQAAEKILADGGTLIVAGHPGVGKTTLARMLVWLHAAQGWKIFVVDSIEEAFEVSNPGEKRLILFDDFLGQVRLSADHVRGIDQRLPPFIERVNANKDLRFILTTREYILSQAELLSKRLASRAVSANRYVLNVGVYTRTVKARILYNHLHFSGLSQDSVAQILLDNFYLKIIDHKNFNPRLIELLTSEEYSSLSGESLRAAVERVLDNPDELWERPYRDHISDDGKALMLAMLLFSDLGRFEAVRATFARVVVAMGGTIPMAQLQARFNSTLKELEGSVLAILNQSVRFSNPGVRDFLQAVVIKDELLSSLVQHTAVLSEFKQCWAIFIAREPKPTPLPADAELWVSALLRLRPDETRGLFELLELAFAMHDHFSDMAFVDVAYDVGQQIAVSEIDSFNVRMVISALEMITLRSLDSDDLEHFHSLLTECAARLLRECGDGLPFEDIEALEEALRDFGNDITGASAAVHAALNSFIPEIDNEMADYGSIDELDEFERKLRGMMKRHGYANISPDDDLKYKRNQLEEDEANRDASDDYSGTSDKSDGPDENSNVHISSMFSDLILEKG